MPEERLRLRNNMVRIPRMFHERRSTENNGDDGKSRVTSGTNIQKGRAEHEFEFTAADLISCDFVNSPPRFDFVGKPG